MKIADKVTMAFSVVLLVVVVGLLAYFIPRHTEAGLLSGCAQEPARSVDLYGKCFELKWRSLPVAVRADSANEKQLELFRSAVRDINRRLGFTALVERSDAENTVAFNQMPITGLPGESGVTMFWVDQDNTLRHTRTAIFNLVFPDILYIAVYHELGHVLGLAHDDYEESVMYKHTRTGTIFSDYDRKLLRELYHK
jgi:predicted Zn-dependent protease